MANPISRSTRRLLDDMEPKLRATTEAEVAQKSIHAVGFELSLEEEINLAKAVKTVAAIDGLSREEFTGLKFLMIMSALPYAVQKHVVAFETEGVTVEHVSDVFAAGSPKARYLLSGALTVAAIDGLSSKEEASARELGKRLQVDGELVEVLIDEARVTGEAMREGDQEPIHKLKRLRDALLAHM